MSATRPRRATIMVGLTALAAGAAIAGGATILNLPSGQNSPEVPLVMGYNGAGNNVGQTGSTPPSGSATVLSGPAATSSATSSSSTPSSSSTSSTTSSSSSEKPPPPPPEPTKTAERKPGSPDPAKAAEVVGIANDMRQRFADCAPLEVDDRLTASAQGHSTDMANRRYFSHTTPEGVTFDQRIKSAGYPSPGAENIAKGQRTAEQVMDAWMRSDGHRRNILNCGYKKIGVGVDTNGFLWTQNFGF